MSLVGSGLRLFALEKMMIITSFSYTEQLMEYSTTNGRADVTWWNLIAIPWAWRGP